MAEKKEIDVEQTMVDSDIRPAGKYKRIRQHDVLVSIPYLKKYLADKYPKMTMSSAALPYLSRHVEKVIARASMRAQANKRTTMLLRDM